MQIAELKIDKLNVLKVILFYTSNSIQEDIDEKDNKNNNINNDEQKKPRYREGGFESIKSNDIKITVDPNIISLVGTSSVDDIGIPLYNN